VTHAVSATYIRFNRMSPTAAALAVLLHVATALALWWVSPLHYTGPEEGEKAIDVTVEPPPTPKPTPPPAPELKVAPPAAAPPAKPAPPPPKAKPLPFGLSSPTPKAADTSHHTAPPDEVQKPQQPQQPQATKAQPQSAAHAAQEQQPPQPQQQQALAPKAVAPQELAPPPAQLEHSLPPLEPPPPPLTSKDFPSPLPPPAGRVTPHPQAHVAPPAQHPQLRPSPLSNPPQRRAPGESRSDAPSATFVNPADQYNQTQLVEQYLWQVATKISQYRYHASQASERGTVVLRLVMARDGRLLDVSIARSSGVLTLDKGLIEAARAAAPYAPFPSGLSGSQQVFVLPFTSVYRPR
jgi:TonB family protein